MANVKIYAKNALAAAGVTIKNGTGGGAPALEEAPDLPMSHLLSPDRETYWRTNSPPPDPLNVDIDLGSSQSLIAAGICKLRLGSASAVTGPLFEVFYDTGGSYNPSGFTNAVTVDPVATPANNNLYEFAATSARFWRFLITPIGTHYISAKLWLVRSADFVDLGHDWSIGTEESDRRLRDVVTSPSGLAFAFEPGQDRGSTIRSGLYLLHHQPAAVRDSLRDSLTVLDSRFMVRLGDSVVIETPLPEGSLEWERDWSAPEKFDFTIRFEEHP